MLTYFPRFFMTRAILCYVITLLVVSILFMEHALPFQFMLFGFVPVCLFFVYSNKLTMEWRKFSAKQFTKKIFVTALIIRIIYVVFIYFYYIEMTGQPHAYSAGDELLYQYIGTLLREYGFKEFAPQLKQYGIGFSDSGYCWWLAFEYAILGPHVLTARVVKCVINAFSCVLIYNLAKRNFGEATGRIAAIFCMLMPNNWFYCGVTLKEIEMAFMTLLFVERADWAIRAPKITLRIMFLPGLIILAMFTFRTALASVLVASLAGALILSSGKQLEAWKKVLYSLVFAAWMFTTVGIEMVQETQQLWAGRSENQAVGYESRSRTNSFAKYASSSVLAPLIFTIPLSSMVAIPNQENQMMMNGANFIKNIMSGFVIFALFALLFNGDWRKHVLPIAVTCGYLVVLAFSNFAHAERFHFPVLAFELMFAAYGISQLKNMHKRWFTVWFVIVCIANFVWAWIKLAGRGWV